MRTLKLVVKSTERRTKRRFPVHREMRYRLLKDGRILGSGTGETVNIGSGGIAFGIGHDVDPDAYIEISISWPVLLEDNCPMRLIVFGRVLRCDGGICACSVEKYEFRTQSRAFQPAAVRNDSMLQRWAEGMEKEGVSKPRAFAV